MSRLTEALRTAPPRLASYGTRILSQSPESAEIGATVPAYILACVFLAPGHTFANPAYVVLAQIMSEGWWGLLLLCSAIAATVASWLDHYRARRWCMFCAFVGWLAYTSLFVGHNPSAGAWVMLAPGVMALLAFMQLGEGSPRE